jgi:hypothetical protein
LIWAWIGTLLSALGLHHRDSHDSGRRATDFTPRATLCLAA